MAPGMGPHYRIRFRHDSILVKSFGQVHVVGALWKSWGIDVDSKEKYSRSGRANIVLKVTDDGLSCVLPTFPSTRERAFPVK